MIYTVNDFYQNAITEIRKKYFPKENHGTTTNEMYHLTTKTLELFNNGQLKYSTLIKRLSKSCNETSFGMHELISEYVVSFGHYKYKTKKTWENI